jgi:murein DD-endopeptidase MepM/ murein hydrolase activator NlpD
MKPAVPIALALLVPAAPVAAGEPVPTSRFGIRSDPVHGGRAIHRGVDLRAASGTPVLAAADGIVRVAGRRGGYGLLVEIVHPDASATRYAHLSRISVRPSQAVVQGELIGDVGTTGRTTGSHLHFEYRFGGAAIDPLPFIGHPEASRRAPGVSPRVAPPVTPHRSAFAIARAKEGEEGRRLADGLAAIRRLDP